MTGTRPDLAFAVSKVSQFAANPTQTHLLAAKRILRYIKGTIDYKIHFGSESTDNSITLKGYSDADWGSDPDSRKSTSGYVFIVNAGAVSWSSKQQPTVALSTAEAEYMALAHAMKEAIWLRTLLAELNFKQDTTVIFEDN